MFGTIRNKKQDILHRAKLHANNYILENMDNKEAALETLRLELEGLEGDNRLMDDITDMLNGPMDNTYVPRISSALGVEIDYVVTVI